MREKGVFFKLQYEHGIRFGRGRSIICYCLNNKVMKTYMGHHRELRRPNHAVLSNASMQNWDRSGRRNSALRLNAGNSCIPGACVPNEEVHRVMTYDCLLMSTKWLCRTAAVLWRWQINETGRACAYCKNMTLASICCLLQIKIFSMEIVFDKFENWVIMRNYYLQCVWKNGPWQLKIVSLRCGSEGAMVFEASDIAGQIRYFSHPCVG